MAGTRSRGRRLAVIAALVLAAAAAAAVSGPAELAEVFAADVDRRLDAEYERMVREGRRPRVLDPTREPVADAGRYLVVDSARDERLQWSPPPAPRRIQR